MSSDFPPLAVVIPAAGIGKRMKSSVAKQYLTLHGKSILENTINVFLELPFVHKVVVVVSPDDRSFESLAISQHPKMTTIVGGKERVNSVFNGVEFLSQQGFEWLMVHDAARPCLPTSDVESLYQTCLSQQKAGILATRVRDTMKRAVSGENLINNTVEREDLWHALTPQCAKVEELLSALIAVKEPGGNFDSRITDEASALELTSKPVLLVEGSARNIKVTHPEDLGLAEIFLQGN